jgi:translation elongation factor EF-G
VVAAIRQHLKKANYHYFDGLHTAFKFYDKDSSGKIDENELREVCFQYNLPVDNDMLRLLIEWCDVDQDGQIDYTEFANFLNWKHHLPSEKELEEKLKQVMTDEVGEEKEDILSPPRLKKQIDESQGDYKTSSQMINAVVGGISTRGL